MEDICYRSLPEQLQTEPDLPARVRWRRNAPEVVVVGVELRPLDLVHDLDPVTGDVADVFIERR